MFVALGACAVVIAVGAFSYFGGNGAFQGRIAPGPFQRVAPVAPLVARQAANGVDRMLTNGRNFIYGVTVSANNADAVLNKLTFSVNGNFDAGDTINSVTLSDENGPQAFMITNAAGQNINNNAVDLTGANVQLNDKITVLFPTVGVKIPAKISKTYYLNVNVAGAGIGNTLSTGLVGMNDVDTVLPRHDLSF